MMVLPTTERHTMKSAYGVSEFCGTCGLPDNMGECSHEYPQTPEEAMVCAHGNTVWFGHECGEC